MNYADPNLNIALPIFIIHGNHDDPTAALAARNEEQIDPEYDEDLGEDVNPNEVRTFDRECSCRSYVKSRRALSAIDILSASGLVNYYGSNPAADKVEVYPILLRKGTSKV